MKTSSILEMVKWQECSEAGELVGRGTIIQLLVFLDILRKVG